MREIHHHQTQQQQQEQHKQKLGGLYYGYGSIVDQFHQNDHDQEEVSSISSCVDVVTAGNINHHHHYCTNNQHRSQIGLLLFGASLLVLSMIAVLTTHPSIVASSSLSFVGMESSSSTTTTSNSLIDMLQSSSTIIHPQSYYKSKVDEYPSVSIDLEHERQVYNGRTTNDATTLSISFTDGQFHSTSTTAILNKNSNNKNIVALQCGDSDSHLYYMDAETIDDATSSLLSTRRNDRSLAEMKWYGAKDFDWWGGSGTVREKTWHGNNNNNNDDTYEYNHETHSGNTWHIAPVPQFILDQRKCQAIIYYYIREDEYVLIGKSTIIHL